MSLLKVRRGRLEWMQVVRSNDMFLGVPYNLVQFTFLQEVVAGWIGVELGTYSQVSDSLHVYEHDLSALRDSPLIDAATSTDRYDLLKPAWDAVIAEMVAHAERFIANDLTLPELTSRVFGSKAPEGYLNMLRILAAETARRRKWTAATRDFGAQCTNPALRQMWERWLSSRPQQEHP
jgi:thymidylate synthase